MMAFMALACRAKTQSEFVPMGLVGLAFASGASLLYAGARSAGDNAPRRVVSTGDVSGDQ